MFAKALTPIAILVLGLMIQGCSTSGAHISLNEMSALPPTAMTQVASRMMTFPDPHEGLVNVVGPPVFDQHGTPPTLYTVMTSIDPKQPGTNDRFRIGIIGLFPKRVFLKDVFTGGRALKTKVHDRERIDCGSGCVTAETLVVTITETDMEAWTASGLAFKVSGRRTAFTMFIPAAYFKAVLERHRAARQSIASSQRADIGSNS